MQDIWQKARKKPVLVHYREVRGGHDGDKEIIKTREGTLIGVRGRDFIVKGIEGEVYPITKTTFHKTYSTLEECPPGFNVDTNCNEKCPKWRCW
jgi:hypothetical protein